MLEVIVTTVCGICLIALAIFMGWFIGNMECNAKTVSFNSSYYSLIAGCMVEVEEGRFLPLSNYREM